MGVRVDLVEAGMRELLGDPGVAAYLLGKAEAVSLAAKADAPVRTGDYKRSIHPGLHRESSGRVVGRVTAGTNHAFLVEAKYGTLGRALNAARA